MLKEKIEDFEEGHKAYLKWIRKLKKEFKDYIKENYFLKLFDELVDVISARYLDNLLMVNREEAFLDDTWMPVDLYSAAKILVMMHRYYTFLLDDNKRLELQETKEYRNKVIDATIDILKIRTVGNNNLLTKSMEAFYPVLILTNILNNLLTRTAYDLVVKRKFKKVKNYEFKFQMISQMTRKIKTCIVLIDNGLVQEAFNPLRSLIELLMVYLTIKEYDSSIIDEYNLFLRFQVEYQQNKNFSKEFLDKFYLNHTLKNTNITDYLNYGWLDSLLEFNYLLKKDRNYKISTLAKIINMHFGKITTNNVGDDLYKVYRECNPMSHGYNIIVLPVNSKLNIGIILLQIIKYLFRDMQVIMDLSFELNGIDLDSLTDNILKKTKEDLELIKKDQKLSDKLNKTNNYYF